MVSARKRRVMPQAYPPAGIVRKSRCVTLGNGSLQAIIE
jgi:hypothetical protein